jgi:hypothetical protein
MMKKMVALWSCCIAEAAGARETRPRRGGTAAAAVTMTAARRRLHDAPSMTVQTIAAAAVGSGRSRVAGTPVATSMMMTTTTTTSVAAATIIDRPARCHPATATVAAVVITSRTSLAAAQLLMQLRRAADTSPPLPINATCQLASVTCHHLRARRRRRHRGAVITVISSSSSSTGTAAAVKTSTGITPAYRLPRACARLQLRRLTRRRHRSSSSTANAIVYCSSNPTDLRLDGVTTLTPCSKRQKSNH